MGRGDDTRDAITYKLMEPIAFCPTVLYPGRTLFQSRGENLMIPQEGDILSRESATYKVDYVCVGRSYDVQGNMAHSSVTVGLLPADKPKEEGLERYFLNSSK